MVKTEMVLKNGMVNGEVKNYFKNGLLHEVCAYKAGKKDGTWMTYDTAGKLIAEANYRNNKKAGNQSRPNL